MARQVRIEFEGAMYYVIVRGDRREAIVSAGETGADFLLMDERFGRAAVRSLGIPLVGVGGVLIEARERGLLTDAAIVIEQLHPQADFWLSLRLRKLIAG